MLSNTRHKRKSSLENNHLPIATNHQSISSLSSSSSSLAKRFRSATSTLERKTNTHALQFSSSSAPDDSTELEAKPMTISNGEQRISAIHFDQSKLSPKMLGEYRRVQHELQCQEALLVLMQKLKTNQKLISQANNNGVKQRTTTPTTTATKLSQQATLTDGKVPLTATKQPLHSASRPISNKSPHPNQYTVHRSNLHSQPQSSKTSPALSQATRQSNTNTNNNTLQAATRISSAVPGTATKNSSVNSTTNNNTSSKTNGAPAEQHLLNAKLALRKQLEQTLLQIPTPKPSTCDLTFIPGVNGWSEFLAYLGLEQALNTFMDIAHRRTGDETSFTLPHVCAQCGTDWSVTWHEMSSTNESSSEEKIFCDRCTKTSQKKLLKQDHSNRLRQAFIKALQQEKELDAKFQQQSSSTTATTTTHNPTSTTNIKQSSSSSSLSQQATKHSHQSSKHASKPVTSKTSSNHHHHHNHNNSNANNHHHHRQHSTKSSSSKAHHLNSPALAHLAPSPAETLASTLAALQNTEQMELFQKHFLSNLLPFAVPNQSAAAAAALAAKTTQQQQAAALAALPAMAASLMRQSNPAQYLLDMIPQPAKQQQHHHHHHRHSK